MGRTIERVIERLECDVRAGVDAAAKLREDLAKDPAHALEWADTVFYRVARGRVAALLLDVAKRGDLEALYRYVCERALQAARYPERSTSPCSNHFSQDTCTAFAEYAELVGDDRPATS